MLIRLKYSYSYVTASFIFFTKYVNVIHRLTFVFTPKNIAYNYYQKNKMQKKYIIFMNILTCCKFLFYRVAVNIKFTCPLIMTQSPVTENISYPGSIKGVRGFPRVVFYKP